MPNKGELLAVVSSESIHIDSMFYFCSFLSFILFLLMQVEFVNYENKLIAFEVMFSLSCLLD